MTGPGSHEAARIPAPLLAAALGVDPQVAVSVLALPEDDLAQNLALIATSHEHRIGNMLSADDATNTLAVMGEIDWSITDDEDRVAAAAFALRLLGKLGITRFDMGAE